MTTNPIPIPLAAGDGLEETPSGRMSSEWLDAVWAAYSDKGINDKYVWDFTEAEYVALATMQGVGPEEAAKRLTGETECTEQS